MRETFTCGTRCTRMAQQNPLVMVAEDETLIRLDAVDALTDAGFEVLEAAAACEALEGLEQNPGITVLFTDINMPGDMDGLALARHVRDRWPGIGVLVTSGKIRPGGGELPPGCRFLPKPYSREHILCHVRSLAEGRS